MKRFIAIFLLFCMLFTLVPGGNAYARVSEAGDKTISLATCKSMALSCSPEYSKNKNKLALAQMKYEQSMKSLQMKIKRITTFSWSPLLSFHFPESLSFSEQSEAQIKPVQLASSVSAAQHALKDVVFSIYEKVGTTYLTVYSYQETIAFEEEQLEKLNENLTKNQARLAAGEASKADVEKVNTAISTLTKKIAEHKRMFEQSKSQLSDLIGLDITVGYRFKDAYVDTQIPRSELNNIVDYTLANDHQYFQKKLDVQVAMKELDTNYNILRNKFGGKLNAIDSYINASKKGELKDTAAFKLAYDGFIRDIDNPWSGKWKILFFKFPKLWLKGESDGSYYIEDSPYILYEDALSVQDVVKEEQQAKKELEDNVRNNFETLVSSRNSYLTMAEQVAKDQENLDKLLRMNALGQCTFEEYTSAQNELDELQMQEADALKTYTSLLFAYDRLSCGYISKYLSEVGFNPDSSSGADSYIVDQDLAEEAAIYYITSIVEDNMFSFNIHINPDYQTDVNYYELYIDGNQIGERTKLTGSIMHLTLSKQSIDKAYVRLYQDDKFIAQAEFDPQTITGPLNVPGEFKVVKQGGNKKIGSYKTDTAATGLMVVYFDFDAAENIGSYEVSDENGVKLSGEERIPYTSSFRHLGLVSTSLGQLTIKCYDSDGNYKYDAYINSSDRSVYIKVEKEG